MDDNKEKVKQAIKIMKKYKELEDKKKKSLTVIEEFKQQHQEIFDTLDSLEYEVELIEKQQEGLKPDIKDAMVDANMKDKEVNYLKFTYVKSAIKRNFNSKKFYENYSSKTKMYKEYVTETPVSDYIKVKELVYKSNNDEYEE